MQKLILLACLITGLAFGSNVKKTGIHWVDWSKQAFETARKEQKLILLDLGAVWCHWCHVMEETTYQDPRVIELFRKHFVAIKVDQDNRPDLSTRYEDYGWPATIIFDSSGKELAKLSGYVDPDDMVSTLSSFVEDPTPGPSVVNASESPAPVTASNRELEAALKKQFYEGYDPDEGAWGRGHKFLNWHCVEYAMTLDRDESDTKAREMALKTLKAQLNLLDPVWGGIYQYSTGGNWKEPHFEKIMQMQAENLRIYARAWALYQDPQFKRAAEAIYGYMERFLMSPQGAFYVSQDADVVRGKHSEAYFRKNDAERRKEGIPRVDKHLYARENGWAIHSLAMAYAYLGDAKYLNAAIRAARWTLAQRSRKDGGFRHDEKDAAGPYLGDSLYMARGFLSLAQVTGDSQWLGHAQKTADFIGKAFQSAQGGFYTAAANNAVVPDLERVRHVEENVFTTRLMNHLYHYTRKKGYQQLAAHGLGYLRSGAQQRFISADTLLAMRETLGSPVYFAVIGASKDPQTQKLFKQANSIPVAYKVVELRRPEAKTSPAYPKPFPKLPRPAAFVCQRENCSRPAFQAEDIATRFRGLAGQRASR